MAKPFKLSERLHSFKYAFRGIWIMLMSQQNAWIHAAATFLVICFGFYFHFNTSEWCWIVLAIVAVWTAEAFNTAFEFLADKISNEYHPLIGKAKDVAAGAVLITAIGAAIVGLIIFGPHILHMLK
ncbi:MAG: diacylglycerol kinase family protein [Candidatus Zhuqueibacterota bacterium]